MAYSDILRDVTYNFIFSSAKSCTFPSCPRNLAKPNSPLNNSTSGHNNNIRSAPQLFVCRASLIQRCKVFRTKTDGAVVKRVKTQLAKTPGRFLHLLPPAASPPSLSLFPACFHSAPTVCPPRTRALPKTISVHISVQTDM